MYALHCTQYASASRAATTAKSKTQDGESKLAVMETVPPRCRETSEQPPPPDSVRIVLVILMNIMQWKSAEYFARYGVRILINNNIFILTPRWSDAKRDQHARPSTESTP